MQQKNRYSVVLSALITTLVMVSTAGGLLAYNGLLPLPDVRAQSATLQAVPEEAPIVVTVQPVLVPAQEQAMQVEPIQAAPEQVASVQTAPVQAATVADSAALATYQAQLDEAYAALQEAYTQIDVLQTAQAQPAAVAYHDDDDGYEEAEEDDDDDDHESGEQEHDDD